MKIYRKSADAIDDSSVDIGGSIGVVVTAPIAMMDTWNVILLLMVSADNRKTLIQFAMQNVKCQKLFHKDCSMAYLTIFIQLKTVQKTKWFINRCDIRMYMPTSSTPNVYNIQTFGDKYASNQLCTQSLMPIQQNYYLTRMCVFFSISCRLRADRIRVVSALCYVFFLSSFSFPLPYTHLFLSYFFLKSLFIVIRTTYSLTYSNSFPIQIYKNIQIQIYSRSTRN